MLAHIDKIIFTGPVGSGKTTAISAISDKPPIRTDVGATDQTQQRKESTTVAMDYGFIQLDEDLYVHLYGTPGQERFDFMWSILCKGGIGLVLLIDNAQTDPLADMDFYLDAFKEFIDETGVVIGITRTDVSDKVMLEDYQSRLMERGELFPIFEIDARSKNDVIILIQSLLALLMD